MPSFLRGTRQGRWDTHPDVPWLQPGELKADVFRNLQTDGGILSIWEVPNGLPAERIAVAIASSRDNLSHMDYIVFESPSLEQLGLVIEQTRGDTPDGHVNSFHYDVRDLTTWKLASLADQMSSGVGARKMAPWLRKEIRNGLADGHLDSTKLKPTLLQKLGFEP